MQGNGTLMVYDLGDSESEVYFIPDGASIPDAVRDALLIINGKYSNCADQTAEEDRACDIVASAIYDGPHTKGHDQEVLGTLAWCRVELDKVVSLQVTRVVVTGFIP